MPERPLKIATYAAGISLAAITLVYVFGPTFFIDGEPAQTSTRKQNVVGLSNPANDCFINSVLQALAGLGDLRLYLIRETHRRKLDGRDVYIQPVEDPARKDLPAWKIKGLQSGLVTQGLKDILDALNERPLYKKSISAAGFVMALERAFRQRISRQQQDAQEFLQVVAERLCDEYHAGHRARQHSKRNPELQDALSKPDLDSMDQKLDNLVSKDGEMAPREDVGQEVQSTSNMELPRRQSTSSSSHDRMEGSEEEGFPLEGGSESQIECLTCGFKPKPTKTTFCSLTLSVPQATSTSLNECFDGMFKTEYIDDFKCEKCRLLHALGIFQQEMAQSISQSFKSKAQEAIQKLEVAIERNPEEVPKGVDLPDIKMAPKRRIAKHVRIIKFPKILVVHLSRSIFDANSYSLKNSAKVSFPERLPLGGLLTQRKYRLSSTVCHKGSHYSGHYESFRRQNLHPPFSTPNAFQASGVYSKPITPNPNSMVLTPQMSANNREETSTLSSAPELLSPASAASTTSFPYTADRTSTDSAYNGLSSTKATSLINTTKASGPTSSPSDTEASSLRSLARSPRSSISSKVPSLRRSAQKTASPISEEEETATTIGGCQQPECNQKKRKKKSNDRWWRISDDKVKESKTSEVLAMQKEVYMLFYEMEHDEPEHEHSAVWKCGYI